MGDPSQPVIFISEVGSGVGLACTEAAIRQYRYNVVGVSNDSSDGLQPLLNSSSFHFVQGDIADQAVQEEAIEVATDEWGHIDALVLIPDGNVPALKGLLDMLREKLENSQLPDSVGRVIIVSEGFEHDLEAHVKSVTASNSKLVYTLINTNRSSGSQLDVGKHIVGLAAGALKRGGKL
ncbi:hypothetical protein M427DRAFT_280927 [Gonapodya prolifera JEL478]|uniref:NAD(P)-binding protein n=1 Tax=Gonapodya prolifera (strain JEL478) TaxID=1344416 RepID=A0A139AYQ0_GONPJ|nr:hypothetical protein M427DRAFT_280927 [Gonapodya prolifera JEL478]|eukprot:KXS21882.1 hypothetical protein M427DRAFT_280927 [Gonapodya prolifera JEL478]